LVPGRVHRARRADRDRAEHGKRRADVYLLDVRLPDGNGIDVLRSLRQGEDATPTVMISGHGTIRDAVEATRSGAFDFLEKPLGRDRVLLVVKNALEWSDLQRENAARDYESFVRIVVDHEDGLTCRGGKLVMAIA